MKCPSCQYDLGLNVNVEVIPLVINFTVGFNARGQLVRTSEISGTETVNIDVIRPATHVMKCPSCAVQIDPSELKYTPTCVRCGKEKAQMTVSDNICKYDGMVCFDCAMKKINYCSGCEYRHECNLGRRVLGSDPSATSKPAIAADRKIKKELR